MDYEKDFYENGYTDVTDIKQVKSYIINILDIPIFENPLKFADDLIIEDD